MKSIILSGYLLTIFSFYDTAKAQKLVVGTYTNTGTSKGIYIYDFDVNTGSVKELSVVEAGNPSYLTASNNNRFIYSVNENNEGKISSFSYDNQTAALSLLNKQPNNGSAPCYVSLDKTGKWLFAGNYGSGNLTLHPVKKDGSIGKIQQLIQHAGNSANKERQAAPHVHCTYISTDNKYLYVPDLGIDKVMIYPFDAFSGKLDETNKSSINMSTGGGPRHIIFSKNGTFGYLIEELTGNVLVIKKDGFKHNIIQTENHLPKNEAAAGADIHLTHDEKFLYVSQRSNSTLQIFKVNSKNGKIKYVEEQSTLGNFPRNFTIHPSGKYLLVANQKSNDIIIFKRSKKTGLLTDTGESIKVGSPVCLQWIGK